MATLCKRATIEKKIFKNKEELASHVHHIHNFLRNNGFGYGMDAMKTFILFYVLKLIEPKIDDFVENNLIDKTDTTRDITKDIIIKDEFKKNCRFSDFLSQEYENDNAELYKHIFKKTKKTFKTCNIITWYLSESLEYDKYWQLIMLVNDIDINNKELHLSGKIYEYFIGRDASAISDLGAYYTARDAIRCIFGIDMPKLIYDEETDTYRVGSMGDPYGGSGGLTCGYVEIIDKELKEKNLVWTREMVNSIYHTDIQDDVIKLARIEIFAITGILPRKQNFKKCNTFMNNFINYDTNEPLYLDNLYSNCPFGGDKTKQTEEMIKNNKVIKFIKLKKDELLITLSKEEKKRWNNKKFIPITDNEKRYTQICIQNSKLIKENKITKADLDAAKVKFDNCSERIRNAAIRYKIPKEKVSNKEAASMVLFMDLLAEGGKCRAVFKEGIFFDGQYSLIREILIKQFNVTHVLSILVDSFSNTKTKTSVIYFQRDGTQTKEVIFSEIQVEKENDDVIEFIEELGEYKLIKDKGAFVGNPKIIEITRASYEDLIRPTKIRDTRASKNASTTQYKDKYEYSLRATDYTNDNMQVKKGWSIKMLGDLISYKDKTGHLAGEGKEIGQYRFYTSSETIQYCDFCDVKNELCIIIGTHGESSITIDNNFSYSLMNFIIYGKNNLETLYIYNYIKNNWLNFKQNIFDGTNVKCASKTKLDNYKIPIPNEFSPELIKMLNELKDKTFALRDNKENVPKMEITIKDKIEHIYKTEYCNDIKIDVIFNIKAGKYKSSDCMKEGLYPFYTGKALQPEGYSNLYCYDSKEYIILLKDGGAGQGKYGKNIGLGNVFLVNGKSGFTPHQVALELKSNLYNIKKIYNILNYYKNDIMDIAKYTISLGTISQEDLSQFKIKIPKDITKLNVLDPLLLDMDNLLETIKVNDKYIIEKSKEFKNYIEQFIFYEAIESTEANTDD